MGRRDRRRVAAAACVTALCAGAGSASAAPVVSVLSPVDGAHYALGSGASVRFACTTSILEAPLRECVAQAPNGAPVDTSTPGLHAFAATGTDILGVKSTTVVHYLVDLAPLPAPAPRLGARSVAQIAGAGVTPALSRDGRVARYAAYVAPDATGHQSIFVVHRAEPWGSNGTPWSVGPTAPIVHGLGGAPPDGDSWAPAFSGNDFLAPRCLGFVSSATNLVPGDGDGQPDAFILGLRSGRLRRVPRSTGASAIVVDARCRGYAFVARGTLYVRDKTGRVRRESGVGGVTNPEISYNGKDVVFERNGQIIYRRSGGGQRAIGPGFKPTADGFGRYVAFERGGEIWGSGLRRGSPRPIGIGVAPSMTSGGHSVFFGQGPYVRLNVKRLPIAQCLSGDVTDTEASPHGNYIEFTCSGGGVFLAYLGPGPG